MADTLQQLSNEMAELVGGATASVVQVDARRRLPATGIAWSDNLIVTAHHVVETDDDIGIGLPDGGRVSAELIGRDPRSDLALLRVQAALQPSNWADADELRVGNLVLALGRPRQQVKASLGIVSGLVSPADSGRRRERMRAVMQKRGPGRRPERRRKRWQRQMMREIGGGLGLVQAGGLIQVDLTMYPGFSGGPLVGAAGKVHGMNTSGFGGGFGVAIPIVALSKSVETLLEHGEIHSGYLGIGVQSAQLPAAVAEALAQETGLLVVSIEAESPAAAAGMLVGDILTTLADTPVEDVDELQLLLSRLEVGVTVKTGYVRGGEQRQGAVTIGAL